MVKTIQNNRFDISKKKRPKYLGRLSINFEKCITFSINL